MFLYFVVVKVSDVKTEKVSTRVNGGQNFRRMSLWECINYLMQLFT